MKNFKRGEIVRSDSGVYGIVTNEKPHNGFIALLGLGFGDVLTDRYQNVESLTSTGEMVDLKPIYKALGGTENGR